MSIIIKVGDGYSPSGKILDKNTHWFCVNKKLNIDESEHAIEYHLKTHKQIYIAVNRRSFTKVTLEHFMSILNEND